MGAVHGVGLNLLTDFSKLMLRAETKNHGGMFPE